MEGVTLTTKKFEPKPEENIFKNIGNTVTFGVFDEKKEETPAATGAKDANAGKSKEEPAKEAPVAPATEAKKEEPKATEGETKSPAETKVEEKEAKQEVEA